MSAALKVKIQHYVCPVCGFILDFPPEDFNICPSCGVEFGAETSIYSIVELRKNWLDRGAPWSSRVQPRPIGWDPAWQLVNLYVTVPKRAVHDTEVRIFFSEAPSLSFVTARSVA
jgi:hypothetical protein